jgi:hypothetical protein
MPRKGLSSRVGVVCRGPDAKDEKVDGECEIARVSSRDE